jgi:DNA-binding transcriptional ArsR family regulator
VDNRSKSDRRTPSPAGLSRGSMPGLSQSTMPHHLKTLVDAGLIERERRGKWVYYRLFPGVLDALAGILANANSR